MAKPLAAYCSAILCLVFLYDIVPGVQTRAQAAPNVMVSIKPIHALVAGVMADVGKPALIVQGARSPHDFSLKPSRARALEGADIIFWVGPGLEVFLQKPLRTLGARARIFALSDARAPAGGHGFLDPRIARGMVAKIGRALALADPANSAAYERNAAALATRITAMIAEVAALLAPVKPMPFFVFHDAYGAFTSAFGLNAAGAVTATPHMRPGARRIAEIRDKLKEQDGICVFAEPQFNPDLVAMVTEGTRARTGTLDPLGAGLPPGEDLYFTLIRNLASSIYECLSATR